MRKRFVFQMAGIGLAAATLCACNRTSDSNVSDAAVASAVSSVPASPVPTSQPATPQASRPVYPSILEGQPSLELGNLIGLLMVAPKQNVGWDLAADSAIQWTDDGYIASPKWAMRHGAVRVNVMGTPSTVLRKKKEELGWSVNMQTNGPAKFGPQTIEIMPGFDGDNQCFGSLYDGCDFDPLPSLKQASIQANLLCTDGVPGNETRVFKLVATGKQDATLVVMDSGGSGGSSTTLTLSPIADRHACDNKPA